MGPALRRAHHMLRDADARIKHVVCLSDGQSIAREQLHDLVAEMRSDGITVSTIAVGNAADWGTLQALADLGEGEFYQVINPASLPRVLVDSVKVVNQPLIKEITFNPGDAAYRLVADRGHGDRSAARRPRPHCTAR